uniref:Protein kinase domain-containing protein n=1 Tax=Astyanax mexicanus TaxID=7994 RepID=A0A3B1JGY4_ASTMX
LTESDCLESSCPTKPTEPYFNLESVFSGKGEFGEVFLAKAKSSEDEEETVVLVKSLQTRDEQLQMDFRRECEMFAKLGHPNITRLLGMCREAEPYYMILEYADMVIHALPPFPVCQC